MAIHKMLLLGMDQKLKRSWGVSMVLLQPPRANSKTFEVTSCCKDELIFLIPMN